MKEKHTKKITLNLDFFYKLGAIIVGVLLSITLARNILIISSANQRIQRIKNEIAELEQKNTILKKQIETSQTDEFKEKQARDKLGLVKEGESVIVLPDEETLRQFSPKTEEEQESLPDPIWKRWVKLFI